MPRKTKTPTTLLETDEEGNLIEVTDARLPGFIQPQQWALEEELQGNEELWHRRKDALDIESNL